MQYSIFSERHTRKSTNDTVRHRNTKKPSNKLSKAKKKKLKKEKKIN